MPEPQTIHGVIPNWRWSSNEFTEAAAASLVGKRVPLLARAHDGTWPLGHATITAASLHTDGTILIAVLAETRGPVEPVIDLSVDIGFTTTRRGPCGDGRSVVTGIDLFHVFLRPTDDDHGRFETWPEYLARPDVRAVLDTARG